MLEPNYWTVHDPEMVRAIIGTFKLPYKEDAAWHQQWVSISKDRTSLSVIAETKEHKRKLTLHILEGGGDTGCITYEETDKGASQRRITLITNDFSQVTLHKKNKEIQEICDTANDPFVQKVKNIADKINYIARNEAPLKPANAEEEKFPNYSPITDKARVDAICQAFGAVESETAQREVKAHVDPNMMSVVAEDKRCRTLLTLEVRDDRTGRLTLSEENKISGSSMTTIVNHGYGTVILLDALKDTRTETALNTDHAYIERAWDIGDRINAIVREQSAIVLVEPDFSSQFVRPPQGSSVLVKKIDGFQFG